MDAFDGVNMTCISLFDIAWDRSRGAFWLAGPGWTVKRPGSGYRAHLFGIGWCAEAREFYLDLFFVPSTIRFA